MLSQCLLNNTGLRLFGIILITFYALMMINIFTIIAGLISMLTALCAVLISNKVYIRQRSFENENHFFKYKIEQYQQLVISAFETLDLYDDIIDDGKYMEEYTFDQLEIDKLADEIEDKSDEFRKSLNIFTLFMPQELSNKLELFYDNLSTKIELEDKRDFDKVEKQTGILHAELDEIIVMMRDDIGIDVLNKKLNHRVKKR